MMKRKIALDVGDVRIGVAVSDLMGLCANPRETYVRLSLIHISEPTRH